MAAIYWNKTGADAHWATVTDNWWDDAAFTVQASAIPQTNDFVYLRGATAPDTGPAAALTLTGFDTQGLTAAVLAGDITAAQITIAEGGVLIMGDPAAPGKAHNWAGDTGTTGTFIFNDEATNSGGTVGDYSTWNNGSYNAGGTVGEFATINSTGDNSGTWTGLKFYIGAVASFSIDASFTHAGASVTFELQNSAASVTGKITSDGGTTPIETIITTRFGIGAKVLEV